MDTEERSIAGKRSGLIGLFGNLILVIIKTAVGLMSNSVAITADAMNNLADCTSSLIMLLSFSLSRREKDRVHPYGHGRMEYVCGFVIALLILFTGVSVGVDGFKRLLTPQPIIITGLTVAVLCISIAGKFAMAWYISRCNKSVDSTVLKAVWRDNLSDALVTAAALAGLLATPLTAIPVDGILGIAVAAVILKSGICSFCENVVLLLGEGIDPDTEDKIRKLVSEYIPAKSIEEISLHDYGPQNRLVYIRIGGMPAESLHDNPQILFRMKQKMEQEMKMNATLYWDVPQAPD
ncbi:cation diffusion facilitator family transporter [Anaerolentibacter hominis]|uniref:cation diffusion facilitator family transporter n=1 Tax=Anaerolentibacter hominis TaxID=3079009 RepID=UPI0031B8056B